MALQGFGEISTATVESDRRKIGAGGQLSDSFSPYSLRLKSDIVREQ